jgi:ADP-ribosylation factor GTPase-activating protein 1
MGEVNANRREDLPPSQGGKYQGFGSTPAPSMNNPAYGTSSAALPTLDELQNEPVAALSKGWSLLSAAVSAAGKIVAEKAMDPTLHENVKGYVSQAGKMAVDTGTAANEWTKRELGVDVADNLGHAASRVKDGLGMAQHPGEGYEGIGSAPNSGMGGWGQGDNALYADGGDDFFDRHGAGDSPQSWRQPDTAISTSSMATSASASSAPDASSAAPAKKKEDWEKDEWADW